MFFAFASWHRHVGELYSFFRVFDVTREIVFRFCKSPPPRERFLFAFASHHRHVGDLFLIRALYFRFFMIAFASRHRHAGVLFLLLQVAPATWEICIRFCKSSPARGSFFFATAQTHRHVGDVFFAFSTRRHAGDFVALQRDLATMC